MGSKLIEIKTNVIKQKRKTKHKKQTQNKNKHKTKHYWAAPSSTNIQRKGARKIEERSTHLSQGSQFRRSMCAVNGAESEGEEGPGRKDDIILTPVSEMHTWDHVLLMLSNIW